MIKLNYLNLKYIRNDISQTWYAVGKIHKTINRKFNSSLQLKVFDMHNNNSLRNFDFGWILRGGILQYDSIKEKRFKPSIL